MTGFILKNLALLHKGTLGLKLKSALVLSISISPFVFIGENLLKWYLSNQDYIYLVLGAIVIDHILGSLHHAFIVRDFTWKKNAIGIAIKLGLVIAIGFLFEALPVIAKGDNILKDYLVIVTRLSVFLYPAGSAFGNMSVVTGGKFPPKAWMDKLSKFNENLNPEDLKPKQE